MAELRDLLAELGNTNVKTLLNSGNAVFQSAKGTPTKHAAEISAAIATKFQFEVPVIVKSAKELAAIVSENPFAEKASDHSRLLVVFVQGTKTLSTLNTITSLVTPPEEFTVGKQAAYLHCATGILESNAGAALLGNVGKATTTRNWATVLKLQALAVESPS